MSYILRPFESGDARAIARLTLDAVLKIGPQAYSADQVRVWSKGHHKAERFLHRADSGHLIYVMADETNQPAAYALLEPDGHLDMLYCSPTHAGKGLAITLLKHAGNEARRFKITKLYTEASELAQPAFAKAGYATLHRSDFEVDGVAIHNYAMEKPLI